MIGLAELTSLDNDGVLINVAHGEVVKQDAPAKARQTGDFRRSSTRHLRDGATTNGVSL